MIDSVVGVLGGSFDPIHHGHLRIALDVREQLALNELRLIPCASPAHRRVQQGSAQRLSMAKLAVGDCADIIVDDREIQRGGISYSIDTLQSLRDEKGVACCLILLLGWDAFLDLPQWQRWQDLLGLAHIVVMTRPGYSLHLSEELKHWYEAHQAVSVDELRARPSGLVWIQAVTALDISATDIRQRISTGRSADFLLPSAVLRFIYQNGLYQDCGQSVEMRP